MPMLQIFAMRDGSASHTLKSFVRKLPLNNLRNFVASQVDPMLSIFVMVSETGRSW